MRLVASGFLCRFTCRFRRSAAGVDKEQGDPQAEDGAETAHREGNRRIAQPAKIVDKQAHGQLPKNDRHRGYGGADALHRYRVAAAFLDRCLKP